MSWAAGRMLIPHRYALQSLCGMHVAACIQPTVSRCHTKPVYTCTVLLRKDDMPWSHLGSLWQNVMTMLQFEWVEDLPNVCWCEDQPLVMCANSHNGRKGCNKWSWTKYSPGSAIPMSSEFQIEFYQDLTNSCIDKHWSTDGNSIIYFAFHQLYKNDLPIFGTELKHL